MGHISQNEPQVSNEPATRRPEFAARVHANQRQLADKLKAACDFIRAGRPNKLTVSEIELDCL